MGLSTRWRRSRSRGSRRVDSVPRPLWAVLYRFLHLCSGHRRVGDVEDFLTRCAAVDGAVVLVDNVDVAYGPTGDLTKDVNVEILKAKVEAGYYDGLHAAPTCGAGCDSQEARGLHL